MGLIIFAFNIKNITLLLEFADALVVTIKWPNILNILTRLDKFIIFFCNINYIYCNLSLKSVNLIYLLKISIIIWCRINQFFLKDVQTLSAGVPTGFEHSAQY
mgnify:CR=1 FL=1